MRIAIDASSLLPPCTGIGNYTRNLVRGLLELDAMNEYVLLVNSLHRKMPADVSKRSHTNLRVRRWRLPGPWLHRAWQKLDWPPIERLAGAADVYFAPASILPPRKSGTPLVATLHDCYFMRHPENCHPLGGLYMRETLPEGLKRCDAILCLSHFTRMEAQHFFDVDADRLCVAMPGVDRRFFQPCRDPELLERAQKRYTLPRDFLLTVATREPRKNFEMLLRAIAHLRDIVQEPPRLVCVGMDGHANEVCDHLLTELQLSAETHFTGYVEEEDMPALYSLALATVLPSSYEGFDLPILESMACGTPVIASDIPAHREAAQDAALFVPVNDSRQMAEAMRCFILDNAARLEFRRRGLEHVESFSWRKTAREALSTFERVVRKRQS